VKALSILVATVLLSTGCSPKADPNYPDSPEGCAAACEHGRDLGCEFAQPSPRGVACEVICQNAEDEGRMWQTPCLAKAESCEQADRCGQ
jgi:hypothetical protein